MRIIKTVLLLLSVLALTACAVDANATVPAAIEPVEYTAQAALKPKPKSEPAPKPEQTPEPTPEPTLTAKLSVVGDLMLHQWQVNDAYNKVTGEYDFDKCFEQIAAYLSDGYAIGNLETVFAGGAYRDYPCFNGVDEFGEAIKRAGFDLLTTANNHSNDQSTKGILRTIEFLDGLGIDHVGTYATQESRDSIFIKDINGITFAFLSYSYGTNGIPLEKGKPYLVNLINEQSMLDDIRRAREYNPDFVVVLPHMGNEYETAPRKIFKDWVQLMFDAGADIVLASHPHVLQPTERVDLGDREGFVIYSLGNFISSQRTQPRDAGVILDLYFEKPPGEKARLVKTECVPTWVQFMNSAGAYDIKILPVVETLNALEAGADINLRSKDVERLKAVYRSAVSIYGDDLQPYSGGDERNE